jgi:hypothetical protein
MLELLEQQHPEVLLSRTPGSASAIATQWNARSQAANHGYSHLSGIDRMRIEFRCFQ